MAVSHYHPQVRSLQILEDFSHWKFYFSELFSFLSAFSICIRFSQSHKFMFFSIIITILETIDAIEDFH